MEDRGGSAGEGLEMGDCGAVESAPEVVYGVKSRISGKVTEHEFLAA